MFNLKKIDLFVQGIYQNICLSLVFYTFQNKKHFAINNQVIVHEQALQLQ